MEKSYETDARSGSLFFKLDAAELHAVEGGFGGGFPVWGWYGGTAGEYDGTSWEADRDGMCYIDGRYY